MCYLCTRFKEVMKSSSKARLIMVAVVQLVRASDCGSECRGFESHLPPNEREVLLKELPFFRIYPLRLVLDINQARPVYWIDTYSRRYGILFIKHIHYEQQ